MNESKQRFGSIDEFRGFAVLGMILVNYVSFYHVSPAFLKHASSTGMTFADLVAPLFLFALGLLFRKSLLSRVRRDGARKAYLHMARRYLILFAIGIAGGTAAKMRLTFDWGILQAIGIAGIIVLPFITLQWWWRVVVAVGGMVMVCLCVALVGPQVLTEYDHGGPLGAVSWGAVILFASLCGDWLGGEGPAQTGKKILIYGAGLTAAGCVVATFIPVSKPALSPSYIVLASGLSAVILACFIYCVDGLGCSTFVMTVLGRNALLIFLLHYVLNKVGFKLIPKASSAGMVITGLCLVLGICVLTAWILDRRKWYLKL